MMDAIRQTMAQEVVRLQRKLATSEKERDALAAHVERLQVAVKDASTSSGIVHICETWVLANPATSLARHDAELRADTLAEVLALAQTMGGDELIRELEYQGAELRRRLDDETDRAR